MITYKNISFSAKTFYGVEFKPGETKSVPGYINCRGMVRVFDRKAKPTKNYSFEESNGSKRGRKKSSESEKVSFAEVNEIKNTTEETTNGNPS